MKLSLLSSTFVLLALNLYLAQASDGDAPADVNHQVTCSWETSRSLTLDRSTNCVTDRFVKHQLERPIPLPSLPPFIRSSYRGRRTWRGYAYDVLNSQININSSPGVSRQVTAPTAGTTYYAVAGYNMLMVLRSFGRNDWPLPLFSRPDRILQPLCKITTVSQLLEI